VVGKYTSYEDSYKSLNEAVFHGGFGNRLKVALNWVEAEALESEGGARLLDNAHGILVPGRFGSRGTRDMMRAAEHARTHGIPLLRDLLRLSVGHRGVRAQRVRARGCGLDRGR
jgi:CTP synthase